jgi:hypothetical protein
MNIGVCLAGAGHACRRAPCHAPGARQRARQTPPTVEIQLIPTEVLVPQDSGERHRAQLPPGAFPDVHFRHDEGIGDLVAAHNRHQPQPAQHDGRIAGEANGRFLNLRVLAKRLAARIVLRGPRRRSRARPAPAPRPRGRARLGRAPGRDPSQRAIVASGRTLLNVKASIFQAFACFLYTSVTVNSVVTSLVPRAATKVMRLQRTAVSSTTSATTS